MKTMEGTSKPATEPPTAVREEDVWFSSASIAKIVYSSPYHGYLKLITTICPSKHLNNVR